MTTDKGVTTLSYRQIRPRQPTSKQFYLQELKSFHEQYLQMDQREQKPETPMKNNNIFKSFCLNANIIILKIADLRNVTLRKVKDNLYREKRNRIKIED